MVNSNETGKGISSDYKVKDQIAATLTPTLASSKNSNTKQPTEKPTNQNIHDDALALMKAQLKEAATDMQRQNKTITELTSEIKSYKLENEDLKLTLRNRDIFKKGQTTRINNLVADLKASQEEVQSLKKRLNNRKSNDDQKLYEQQIAELQMTITELTVKLRDTEADYAELLNNYDKLVKQSAQAMKAQDEVDGVRQSLSDAKAENAVLEEYIAQQKEKYESKIAKLTADFEGVTNELTQIKARENIETAKFSKVSKELGHQTLLVQEAQRKEASLIQQLDQMQARADELERKSVELEQQLAQAVEQQKETAKLHEELKVKLETAEQERAKLQDELNKANEELGKASEVAATLQQENATFKEQHVDCLSKAEVESLQVSLRQAQNDLATSLSEKQELAIEVENKAKGIQSQQKEIAELHNKLKSMEGVNQMAQNEVLELEKKIVSLNKDLENMAQLCSDYEQRAIKAEKQADAFKDLAKMYGAVLAGVTNTNPEAGKLFDDELGRHVGSYMHLIELL
ncbi:MAG: hypothetical protein ABS904_00230 [Solibacillus isronensis]